MNVVQKTAFHRALPLLAASGVRYFIIDDENQQFTNDPTMIPAPPAIKQEVKKERTRVLKYKHGALKALYQEPLSKLLPSNGWNIEVGSEELAHDLRSAASAYCSRVYGNGSCMSSVTGKQVQILRIY